MLAVIETSDYIIAEAFLTLHLARDFTVHRFFSTHLWHHCPALKFDLECKTLKRKAMPSEILVTNIYIYIYIYIVFPTVKSALLLLFDIETGCDKTTLSARFRSVCQPS